MSIRIFITVVIIILSSKPAQGGSPVKSKDIRFSTLVEMMPPFDDSAPIEAAYEQAPPLFLGLTPLERAFGEKPEKTRCPAIRSDLKAIGEKFLAVLAKRLGLESFESEMWPTREREGAQDGLLTWCIPRVRRSADSSWEWLDESMIKDLREGPSLSPILPKILSPTDKPSRAKLFDHFLKLPGLYDKPLFSDAIWTSSDGSMVYETWPIPARRESLDRLFSSRSDVVARIIPQLPVFNNRRISIVAHFEGGRITWPDIAWKDSLPVPVVNTVPHQVIAYPQKQTLLKQFSADVSILTGEKQDVFPKSGRRTIFKRKNNAQPDNQLGELVDYLIERYQLLNIATRRVDFKWEDRPQAMLIAVIPGSLAPARNKPVLIADHIDTAFAEDVFEKKHHRISNPGGNDNASATAALLMAAQALKAMHPLHDIWFVHLTGEEFPGDCLGARYLVHDFLARRQTLGGVIVFDMIGHKSNAFQINPGESQKSLEIAAYAFASARTLNIPLKPVILTAENPLSYLYNTDGIIFSNAGYPVILLNEAINRSNYLKRDDYHKMIDTASNVDATYATSIAKVGIETALQLALRKDL